MHYLASRRTVGRLNPDIIRAILGYGVGDSFPIRRELYARGNSRIRFEETGRTESRGIQQGDLLAFCAAIPTPMLSFCKNPSPELFLRAPATSAYVSLLMEILLTECRPGRIIRPKSAPSSSRRRKS
jgi:hypothetical protein